MIAFQSWTVNQYSLLTIPAVIQQRISAGEPLEIEPAIERVDLNEFLARGSDASLLLRINGDSMEDVPILSGDYVMLDRLRQPKAGDIVVARLNGGYTIKRHKLNDARGNPGLYLVPCNGAYKPRKITKKDDYEIIGVVTFIIHPTM